MSPRRGRGVAEEVEEPRRKGRVPGRTGPDGGAGWGQGRPPRGSWPPLGPGLRAGAPHRRGSEGPRVPARGGRGVPLQAPLGGRPGPGHHRADRGGELRPSRVLDAGAARERLSAPRHGLLQRHPPGVLPRGDDDRTCGRAREAPGPHVPALGDRDAGRPVGVLARQVLPLRPPRPGHGARVARHHVRRVPQGPVDAEPGPRPQGRSRGPAPPGDLLQHEVPGGQRGGRPLLQGA
mmetsp:Transcript_9596/g.27377  ORF Transcript_9596/g.27377 Transcript_9596/m.27377 type:complete len:235 (+) Transcript_9596:302-1006(+)